MRYLGGKNRLNVYGKRKELKVQLRLILEHQKLKNYLYFVNS